MPAPTAAATDVEALLALATSALQSGQPANAIPFLRDVARRRPEAALIHHDLGLACLETGLLDEAVIALKRAVTINPRYPEGHLHLGVVLERLGDTAAALSAYHHTTALAPSLTEAWYRSGALVYLLGHHDEATECFVRARESGPTTKFGRLAAARALLGKGRDTEGERALRKLIAADPNDALAHDLLGNLLAEAGRFTEAIDSFQCAIAISPWMAGCYYDLVRCRRITADDAGLIADMQQALDIPGLVPEHRVRVHLALGKAAEDLRDYPRAMDHFTAANAARTATATFDSAQFDREITRLIEQTAPALVARASQLGNPDATPILIIGMPRSGTTLLEQIISSHPAVHGAGELNYWASYGAHWQQRDLTGNPTAFLQDVTRAFNASVVQNFLPGPAGTATKTTTATLPSIDATYRLSATTNVLAQFSQGSLVPSQSFFYTAKPSTGNQANAETAAAYQLGLVHQTTAYGIGIDAFMIDFGNYVSTVTQNNDTVYVNSGRVRYQGTETEGHLTLGRGMSVIGNGSLLQATFRQAGMTSASQRAGDIIPYAPTYTGLLGVVYEQGPWSASVLTKFVGSEYQGKNGSGDGTTYYVHAYHYMNATLTRKASHWLGAEHVRITAAINNLENLPSITDNAGPSKMGPSLVNTLPRLNASLSLVMDF
jgi:tetratricopeptide (TPR) repeat protein